jgi:hypothetical protein
MGDKQELLNIALAVQNLGTRDEAIGEPFIKSSNA